MRDIRNEINRINEVVSFPTVVAEILDAMTDEKITTSKITRLIESDPALTTKMLRVANSPFYGLRGNVKSIQSAITMLGLDETGRLLLTYHMKARLISLNQQQNARLEALWKHSVTTATVSRMVASRYKFLTDGKEYTAGLLHDMGKLVLIQYFPETNPVIEQMIRERSLCDVDAEVQVASISHTSIGSQLGEKWRLPSEFVEVMRCHHDVRTSEQNPLLTAVVRFADLLCEQWGYGVGEQPQGFTLAEDKAIRMLGEFDAFFRDRPLEQVIQDLTADFEKNLELIQLLS
ncbi:MAG: HDOD domain-containing protein [Ignavibacteriales bacterium]|nr:HDOD domain-containing protein [Ignavibacteriales bacterium]